MGEAGNRPNQDVLRVPHLAHSRTAELVKLAEELEG